MDNVEKLKAQIEENKTRMEEASNLVLQELRELTKNKDLDLAYVFDNDDIAKKFLSKNDIKLYSDYEGQLLSPFAIAQYILLYHDVIKAQNKMEEYLDKHFDKNKVIWLIPKKLAQVISFSHINSSGTFHSDLSVKFDFDDEDTPRFVLLSGLHGWKIKENELKALLYGETIQNFEENLPFVNNSNQEKISLTTCGVKITIEKQ